MDKKIKITGSMIGVGTAIGAAVFAATNEPTWLAVGVASVSYTHLTLPTILLV